MGGLFSCVKHGLGWGLKIIQYYIDFKGFIKFLGLGLSLKPSNPIKPLPNNQTAPGTGTAAISPGRTAHA
jgi:hypothetical protein